MITRNHSLFRFVYFPRIFSKLVELAKLEMQSLDRKMIRKNLDNFKKSPVADERPKSTENDKQSPTRKTISVCTKF